jgi:uncharacterized Zn finger protein (UPF0148 family)
MSDFDEEAERERLREKYEQDQQDRQATEKMSELLLQGATMTNAHCSDCGDPVFRYEGQEFCATCEKAIDRGDGASGEDDSDSEDRDAGVDGAAGERDGDGADVTDGEAGAPDDEHIRVTSPDETRVQFGSGDADGETTRSESSSQPDRTPDEPEHDTGRDPRDRPTQSARDADGRQPEPAPERVPSVDPSPAAGTGSGSPDRDAGTTERQGSTLPEARASLERTLARLTRQAEAAEDPTQAREYLAAAREAAETLAALRQ